MPPRLRGTGYVDVNEGVIDRKHPGDTFRSRSDRIHDHEGAAMSATDTPTAVVQPAAPITPAPRNGWIDHWEPESPAFWEATGRTTARRNLIFSILAEHLGFSVWLLWSVSAALLTKAGFGFTPQQLFWLVAIPNLVGSLLRLPYTFAVPRFGGRNWTVVSALLLVIP